MASRFYLPSSGTAAVSPTPAGADWEHINTVSRQMDIAKINSALASVTYTPDAADHLVNGDALFAQFVSRPLTAQTISAQTIGVALNALEAHANNNCELTWKVYVVDSTGVTVRGTLVAIRREGVELGTSAGQRFDSATCSAVVCSANDRIVFEVGIGGTPTATGGVQGHNGTIEFGDPNATGDLSGADGGSTAGVAWINFANTITIASTTFTHSPGGALTSAGVSSLQVQHKPAGSVAHAGVVRQQSQKIFIAAVPNAGGLRKQVNKLLPRGVHYDTHLPYDAHIPYDGTVAPILMLDGSAQPVKIPAGSGQTVSIGGTLSSSGALRKQVNKIITGAVALAGAVIRVPARIFPGTLGSAGALSRQTNKRITGTLTLAGTVTRRTNKLLAGALALVGTLLSKPSRLFTGTLTTAGSNVAVKIVGSLQTLSIAGAVTFSGILTQIKKKFITPTGILTAGGVLRRVTLKQLAGAVTPAGVVHFFLPRKFTGVLGLAGAAFKQANKKLKRGLHYDAPLSYDAHVLYDSHDAPMLFLKGSLTRDKSGVAGVFVFGTLNSSGQVSKLVNKAFAGTLILSGPVTLVTRRFITKLSRMVTRIQLDARFSGLRHAASKIGVAVTTHAQTQRIVTSVAKKISIAPRVER